jgi:predicted kinase
MTKQCIIMRGVPGSGKSTAAADFYECRTQEGHTATICSADNYFMVPVDPADFSKGTVYRYNPDRIGDAHRTCRRQAEAAMRAGIDYVIIDNTNTKFKEFSEYVYMAYCHDYEVEFVEPQTPWWHSVKPLLKGNKREKDIRPHCKVFAERNTHGVPEHTILKMLMRWEPDPTVDKLLELEN